MSPCAAFRAALEAELMIFTVLIKFTRRAFHQRQRLLICLTSFFSHDFSSFPQDDDASIHEVTKAGGQSNLGILYLVVASVTA
jgi:hypothetical protein